MTARPRTFELKDDRGVINLLSGAKLYLEVIDEDLEKALVRQVDWYIEQKNRGQLCGVRTRGKVNVQPNSTRCDFQAGPRYDDYARQNVITEGDQMDGGGRFAPEPMPACAFALRDALARRGIVPEKDVPDIFLANNYAPEQFTLNHTDAKYIQRPLIVTTLLTAGYMVFGKTLMKQLDPEGRVFFVGRQCDHLTVTLPPRSTLVLEGRAADNIQHAINQVRHRRISILLRKTHLQQGNNVIHHRDTRTAAHPF